jgi:ribosome maturation protein SDO1
MVKVEEAVIARFEKDGQKFEVLVDPDLALDLKKGKQVNFNELLAIDSVFKDAHKGETQSDSTIQKAFGTVEVEQVAKHIILNGSVQLTTDQRRKMLEQRRKEIITFISQNAINPQTSAPHPPQRIELAMEEAKCGIEVFKSAEEQAPEIIKAIRRLIPISMEKLKVAVKIPAEFSGKANVVLHKFELKQSEWQRDGSLVAVLELPAGLKNDLFNELNHITHGNFESKILEK